MDDEQKFAADVTEDGNVTGSDAQAILRFLAFYTNNIGSTGQWRFTPADSSFMLDANAIVDFDAYLLGDANLDWGSGPAKTIASNVRLDISEVEMIGPKEVVVPIKIEILGGALNTLVFSMSYDANCLRYISAGQTLLSQYFMIVANGDEAGKIHIAMAGVKGIANDGEILRLVFEKIGDQVSTALEITRAAANDLGVNKFAHSMVSFTQANMIPEQFELSQNYPNPFNPETTIKYQVANDTRIILRVFDLLGKEIKMLVNEEQSAGFYNISWDGIDNSGTSVASGIYLYSIEAGNYKMMRKMILVR